jgi:hypothetical protein
MPLHQLIEMNRGRFSKAELKKNIEVLEKSTNSDDPLIQKCLAMYRALALEA